MGNSNLPGGCKLLGQLRNSYFRAIFARFGGGGGGGMLRVDYFYFIFVDISASSQNPEDAAG